MGPTAPALSLAAAPETPAEPVGLCFMPITRPAMRAAATAKPATAPMAMVRRLTLVFVDISRLLVRFAALPDAASRYCLTVFTFEFCAPLGICS